MLNNIFIVNKHSQIRELGSSLKFEIINELFHNPATCQQLADIFGITKQKMHYNLKCLYDEDLIDIVKDTPGSKEVYYNVKAKNYILDFSMGVNTENLCLNNREIVQSILENNYDINLNRIAAKLLDESLKIKPGQKLMVVTGKFNLPFVEKLLQEAGRRRIVVTLDYQDIELIKERNEVYSLSAFKHHYDSFNRNLKKQNFYLNLNGEARYVRLDDKKKIEIRNRAYGVSRSILQEKKIKVAIMPGLIQDTLSEHNVVSEINFWKALDIDYSRLYNTTKEICYKIEEARFLEIESEGETLSLEIEKVIGEFGSFNDDPLQSPTINFPGGEILIIPKPGSIKGNIKSKLGYAFGEKIENTILTIKDNKIKNYKSENEDIIQKAIDSGGEDGAQIAMICLGTNYNMDLEVIDSSYINKSSGLLTIYWGENVTFGGKVRGECEWHVQIKNPRLIYK